MACNSNPCLINRVKEAKKKIKQKTGRANKVEFFDKFYGSLLKKESIRLDNIWAGYVADKEFTEKLEKYAKTV